MEMGLRLAFKQNMIVPKEFMSLKSMSILKAFISCCFKLTYCKMFLFLIDIIFFSKYPLQNTSCLAKSQLFYCVNVCFNINVSSNSYGQQTVRF